MAEKTSTDRTPTTWVNFVSPEFVREETENRTYVAEPKVFEGELIFLGTGESKVGKYNFPSDIFVIQNGQKKYGFNLPKGSYFYIYVHNGRKAYKGDKVRISYLGKGEETKLPVHPNAHVIMLEIVERASRK